MINTYARQRPDLIAQRLRIPIHKKDGTTYALLNEWCPVVCERDGKYTLILGYDLIMVDSIDLEFMEDE